MEKLFDAMLNLLRFHSQVFYHMMKIRRDMEGSPDMRKALNQDIRRLTMLVKDLQAKLDKYRKGGDK